MRGGEASLDHRPEPGHPGVVVLTGAGGGLGRALVSEFAAQGWRVVAAHHRPASWPETERVWPVSLDVTDAQAVAAVAGRVLQRWGSLQVLINNAGITADRLVWQMDEDDWDEVVAVNLKGAFLCAQAVLPAMSAQRSGHIVNVASFSARQGPCGQANYAAAKAGLIGLTESLAREVGACNIQVNAVLPGVLPTAMTARLSRERTAELVAANALRRLNSTEEVARFIAFLVTLRDISGQVFQLDSRIARWC